MIDLSIGVLQEFAELASHEITNLVDIIRYQAPLPTAADFPALEREARAYFAEHAYQGRSRRDQSRHAPRLAKLRSITAAKLTPRVCACPCRQTFTPTALGLKRIYATPQCKHRGRAEQQTTTMKEAA